MVVLRRPIKAQGEHCFRRKIVRLLSRGGYHNIIGADCGNIQAATRKGVSEGRNGHSRCRLLGARSASEA